LLLALPSITVQSRTKVGSDNNVDKIAIETAIYDTIRHIDIETTYRYFRYIEASLIRDYGTVKNFNRSP